MAGKVGLRLPFDYECEDLAVATPFKEMAAGYKQIADSETPGQTLYDGTKFSYSEETLFNKFFPQRNDAVVKMSKHLLTDVNELEYLYICADTFSFGAFLAQLNSLGIEVPENTIKVIDFVNNLNFILKKLNMSLKVEGGLILGSTLSGNLKRSLKALKSSLDPAIAGYAWDNLVPIDTEDCAGGDDDEAEDDDSNDPNDNEEDDANENDEDDGIEDTDGDDVDDGAESDTERPDQI